MNIATVLFNDDYFFAKKIYQNSKRYNYKTIAIILGNYELNGCPISFDKEFKTNKLLEIGYDLVIEIPSIIYLSNVNNLANYIIYLINNLSIDKIYLPSEFNSLKSFKDFHSKYSFYYPSYDKVFHYYLDSHDFIESKIKTKMYINRFYQSRVYDYLNLNLIQMLRKNKIKFKLVKSNYKINVSKEINDSYFNIIKLFISLTPKEKILDNDQLDINTINMLKNNLYKINEFSELEKLSAPKNYQYSTFFRSIILSLINFNKITLIDIDSCIIKYIGIGINGSKIIREFKKNNKEKAHLLISKINPSNSLIENYQLKLELLYSYLCNKYNSNSDLYKFPIILTEIA